MTDPKYISTAAMANLLGVAPSTIATMVASGEIPLGTYIKAGRVFRFDPVKVEQALLTNTAGSGDDGQLHLDLDNDKHEENEE